MSEIAAREVGSVISVKGYLLSLNGLPSVRVNDIIEDEAGRRALVQAVTEEAVEALLLDQARVNPGRQFYRQPAGWQITPGDHLKGQIINALGEVVTEETKRNASAATDGQTETLAFNVVAKNIEARKLISQQLITGFGLVDILVPIGKGQKELVYGPMHSGKARFLREVMITQQAQGTICIYAVVGKPITYTAQLWQALKNREALERTIVIDSSSKASTPMISIAPSTALLIAEYFCRQGEDVLLVLDDLGLHAKYLREIALLAGRLPGRESYPGDIFYQHAHLMERGGSFNDKQGGGTITLLPVLETEMEGYTNLIPTNLMACTDGHLFFSTEMETEGFMPAIEASRSVSRIGHSTQNKLGRELATQLMSVLSEYPRHQEYSRFGTQLSAESKKILKQGQIIHELLNQNTVGPLSPMIQTLLLSLVFTTWFEAEERNLEFLRTNRPKVIEALSTAKELTSVRELVHNGEQFTLADLIKELEEQLKLLDQWCPVEKAEAEVAAQDND